MLTYQTRCDKLHYATISRLQRGDRYFKPWLRAVLVTGEQHRDETLLVSGIVDRCRGALIFSHLTVWSCINWLLYHICESQKWTASLVNEVVAHYHWQKNYHILAGYPDERLCTPLESRWFFGELPSTRHTAHTYYTRLVRWWRLSFPFHANAVEKTLPHHHVAQYAKRTLLSILPSFWPTHIVRCRTASRSTEQICANSRWKLIS